MDEEDFENVSDEKDTATETGLRYSILAIFGMLCYIRLCIFRQNCNGIFCSK